MARKITQQSLLRPSSFEQPILGLILRPPGGGIDGVPKQAVARVDGAHDAGHHRPAVEAHSHADGPHAGVIQLDWDSLSQLYHLPHSTLLERSALAHSRARRTKNTSKWPLYASLCSINYEQHKCK